MFICDRGTGAQQFRGLVINDGHRRYKFEFSFVGNDRRLSQKSGARRGKKKRSRLSRFVPVHIYWDIYDFEFSLVGKIRDDQEKVKSQTVWDFSDI